VDVARVNSWDFSQPLPTFPTFISHNGKFSPQMGKRYGIVSKNLNNFVQESEQRNSLDSTPLQTTPNNPNFAHLGARL